jgi:probable FeS assembly SUF system protein SufT
MHHASKPKIEKTLLYDLKVTHIPNGTPALLQEGSVVNIFQNLGDTITVEYQHNLYRLKGDDSPALGMPINNPCDAILNDKTLDLDAKSWALLKTCYDPEIPVDIVSLGLIYALECTPMLENADSETAIVALSDQTKHHIYVGMTLTAPGCGMGPILIEDIKVKLSCIEVVQHVTVELIFDPPWQKEMMSDEAKLHLGMI